MITTTDLLLALDRLDACNPSREWVRTVRPETFAAAWQQCPNAAWMAWLLDALHMEPEVRRAAAACLRTARRTVETRTDILPIIDEAIELGDRGGLSEALAQTAGRAWTAEFARGTATTALLISVEDLARGHASNAVDAAMSALRRYGLAWEDADAECADAIRGVVSADEVETALETFLTWTRRP